MKVWLWGNYFEHWGFSCHSELYKHAMTHLWFKFRGDYPNPKKLGDGSGAGNSVMGEERGEFEHVYFIEIIIPIAH